MSDPGWRFRPNSGKVPSVEGQDKLGASTRCRVVIDEAEIGEVHCLSDKGCRAIVSLADLGFGDSVPTGFDPMCDARHREVGIIHPHMHHPDGVSSDPRLSDHIEL